MRLYFAIGLVSICALLFGFSYFAWQSRQHWKREADAAKAQIGAIVEENNRQAKEIDNYVKKLASINERHNARIVRHSMSCVLAPAKNPDGAGGATGFGDPYPAISAYQAACERAAAKLEAFQNLYGGK